jgi:hypothetical protein
MEGGLAGLNVDWDCTTTASRAAEKAAYAAPVENFMGN